MNGSPPDIRTRLFGLEQFGIKLGLDQIRGLLRRLHRPDLAFESVVVAGTNGKGSVAAMLECGLRAAGLRTGRYTSPHLVDLEERFVVDGHQIAPATLDRIAERVMEAATALPLPPSFFEATTAVALEWFRDEGVAIAVLEVGLGGRLDATNAVTAATAAITAIDFDHEQYLGHTLEAIAREKAGVIKPGSLVVLSPNPEPVEAIVRETCATVGATLIHARSGVTVDAVMHEGRATVTVTTATGRYGSVRLGLRGRHQIDNAVTVMRTLEAMSGRGDFALTPEIVRAAVEDVVWPGRLELVHAGHAEVMIDGAHNPAGARALATFIGETYGRRVPFVLAMMRDKSIAGVLRALAPVASAFVCTAPATARALPASELLAMTAASVPSVSAVAVQDPLEAVAYAATLGTPVVVAGSLYLAGEVRAGLGS